MLQTVFRPPVHVVFGQQGGNVRGRVLRAKRLTRSFSPIFYNFRGASPKAKNGGQRHPRVSPDDREGLGVKEAFYIGNNSYFYTYYYMFLNCVLSRLKREVADSIATARSRGFWAAGR